MNDILESDWMKSGRYLPIMMRDFHDCKDLFKTMHSLYRDDECIKDVNWIRGHIYTTDVFLWYMASRGYTLQKTRKKGLQFRDIGKDIQKYKDSLPPLIVK